MEIISNWYESHHKIALGISSMCRLSRTAVSIDEQNVGCHFPGRFLHNAPAFPRCTLSTEKKRRRLQPAEDPGSPAHYSLLRFFSVETVPDSICRNFPKKLSPPYNRRFTSTNYRRMCMIRATTGTVNNLPQVYGCHGGQQ
jgi:hypothetical protein